MFPILSDKKCNVEKKQGAFKLDTTIQINEHNIIKKHTFRINENINLNELKTYILSKINDDDAYLNELNKFILLKIE